MRLLRCQTCKTIEELPDAPAGIDPNYIEAGQDPLLDVLVARHPQHIGSMFHVDDRDWGDEHKRKGIMEQINSGTTGIEGDFYDLKNTFQEDALTCFAQHLRPSEGCPDYRSEVKLLSRPTADGRALAKAGAAPKVWLCSFCPVQSWVTSQANLRNPAFD